MACHATFPIIDGIPVFVAVIELDDSAHKARQAAFFDEENSEYEITRPHGAPAFYQWLFDEKFRRSVRGLPDGVSSVLTVCSGSGMDAEYLARAGWSVIASDISLGAAQRTRERARRYGLAIMPIVADAERLPFADRGIDLVYVHDGLHHLEDPVTGLREMTRVAARAISISEPTQAAATQLAVRLGISQRVEEAGNVVARLEPSEIEEALADCGFEVVRSERYAMFYRHRPGPVFAVLSLPGLNTLSRWGWRIGNRVLGRVGNKLTVQGVRKS